MAETDTSSAPSHPLIESDQSRAPPFTTEREADRDHQASRHGKVSGHVVYAVTSFGGFVGVGSETHSIPWEQLHYDTRSAWIQNQHHGGAAAESA